MESIIRNTAYKVWIADLVRGNYVRGEEQFDAGYINIKNKKVSRVNLISGVVDKFSGGNYSSLTLDDGSGTISIKAWGDDTKLFLDVEVGDLVLVVGKVKQYGGSVYIVPEVVKKTGNPLWLKLRKLELQKEYGNIAREDKAVLGEFNDDSNEVVTVVEERVQEKSPMSREVILSLVESLDFGDGADLDKVVEESRIAEARNVIQELVQEGEIFELHSGKLRITG